MKDARVSPHAVLWAAAVVLAGLVIVQSSRLGGGEARAELVTQVGGFTLMTANAGSSEDVVVTIDNRREVLMVYKVVNQGSLELFKKYELPRVFADARAKAQGRK